MPKAKFSINFRKQHIANTRNMLKKFFPAISLKRKHGLQKRVIRLKNNAYSHTTQ